MKAVVCRYSIVIHTMSKDSTDIIIIGAGIAGLVAGCYAQMNGYHSEIFEQHDQPGGLCTAWERQSYHFDGCLHYLFGSAPRQPFYSLWEELGVVHGRAFVHHDELMRLTNSNGKTLTVYSDPNQLEAHLILLSPRDKRRVQSFCQGIKALQAFDLSLLQQKPKALMTLGDWVHLVRRALPFLTPMAKWGRVSVQDFADQLKDPFLRRAIPHMFGWSSIPMIAGMSLLAYMYNRNAGFPIGGSLAFARDIEQRYLALGGKVHYNAQVEKIVVSQNRALGVQMYDQTRYFAKRVISAGDGRSTLVNLLEGQYMTACHKHIYGGYLPVRAQIQISLGVNRDFSTQPHWVTHLLDQPIEIAGEARSEIGVKHYCFDPTLAPKGKSVITVMLTAAYDYWQRIYGRSLYHTEEIRAADRVIDQLERFYPGIKTDIDCVDVATPLSYERYTGNWQGSSCGWLLNKKTLPLTIVRMRNTLPGLHHFYQIGQWVEPGGSVPVVAMSGRNVIQQICHEDKRAFTTVH